MKRFCEYCREDFESEHGLRRYCPSKDGIPNYCKQQARKLEKVNLLRGAFDETLLYQQRIYVQLKHNEKLLNEFVDLSRIKTKSLINRGFNFHVYEKMIKVAKRYRFKLGTFVYELFSNGYVEITHSIKPKFKQNVNLEKSKSDSEKLDLNSFVPKNIHDLLEGTRALFKP